MIMLIIFFVLILILLVGKIKIGIILTITNNDVCIKLRILGKVYTSERKLIDAKRNKKKDYNKEINFSKELIKKTEIEETKIDLNFGTPLVFLDIYITVILSTLISMIFMIPFKKKENLTYKVIPNFNELFFYLNINAIVKFKIYHFIMILIIFFKRREKNGGTSNKKTYG